MATPVVTIVRAGKPVDVEFALISVEVDRQLDRIPDARLVLFDGSVARGDFPISDSEDFQPGNELEIKIRYEGDGSRDATVFKGLVMRHGVESSADRSVLTVRLKDAAVRMAHARKSAVFRDLSDAGIIEKLIGASKLAVGGIPETQPKHAELVQYRATDWDFMLSRADVQGLVVAVTDGVISAAAMAVGTSAVATFTYGGDDILELECELDASRQLSATESRSWDIGAQALTAVSKGAVIKAKAGNLDGSEVAAAIGFSAQDLTDAVPLAPGELKSWADARMAKSQLSMLRGRLVVPGRTDVKLLSTIELLGVGERFNGLTLVTGLRHRVSRGMWHTEIDFGLSPAWYCRRDDIAETRAAGLLPPVSGLQIGVVDTFEKDAQNEYRIRVRVPALGPDEEPIWARLSTPDAGEGHGVFFWPQPEDEVVLGFFNSDPRQAVVLGSLYSSAKPPPEVVGAPSAENSKKAIVTKSGTTIGFVDGDDGASVTIETAAGNKIVIDDVAHSIQLSDEHGNCITMNEKGITVASAKNLILQAKENVEIAGKAVDVK